MRLFLNFQIHRQIFLIRMNCRIRLFLDEFFAQDSLLRLYSLQLVEGLSVITLLIISFYFLDCFLIFCLIFCDLLDFFI